MGEEHREDTENRPHRQRLRGGKQTLSKLGRETGEERDGAETE